MGIKYSVNRVVCSLDQVSTYFIDFGINIFDQFLMVIHHNADVFIAEINSSIVLSITNFEKHQPKVTFHL